MIITRKNLFVIGDSNIYGDEQLNDNVAGIAVGIADDGSQFNWPSTRTYPYYIKNRQVRNFSSSGLSLERCSDIYSQLILPRMKPSDELLVHIPPATRNVIHKHTYYEYELTETRVKHFKHWCKTVTNLEYSKELFHLFLSLYIGQNINPGSLEQWIEENKAPQVAKWMDTKFWNKHNNLSRLQRYINLIENTSPGKNYYVFTTGATEVDLLKLNKALDNTGIDIVDRTIDDKWTMNMNKITQQLKIPRYPHGHYAPLVHQVYHDKFVEKHFSG